MQDHCVSVMFQIFNFIWRHGTAYRGLDTVPHCFAYEVVPTSVQMGYIEGVSNVQSLGDVDWKAWYARHAHEPSGAVVDNLVHSAAGAFVGGYVLGATDRHWGNMVLKDDTTLLHIDFSFILGDAPPIDAPRISVPPAMEKVFKGVRINGDSPATGLSESSSRTSSPGTSSSPRTSSSSSSRSSWSKSSAKSLSLWDAFVEATVAAFVALRKDAHVVLRAADMLFGRAGFDRQQVRDFLKGKSGLALDKTQKDAADYLRKKLVTSSGHWKTHFKRFVHDVVNPAWYAMVQKGPLPADGVMRMINRYQAESPSTQRLTAQQDLKNEQSQSAVNIEE